MLTPLPNSPYPQNKMKINDWSSIQTQFDELNKKLDRCQKFQSGVTPRAYIRMIVELEDFLNETLTNKDVKKKMSPTNAKALNTMRQRLKKHMPAYAELCAKFRENPESTEEEPEEESEEEPSEEEEEGEEDDEGFKKQVCDVQDVWICVCGGGLSCMYAKRKGTQEGDAVACS